ncbi:MAG: hypothetical protein WA323_03085 [Candidatus Nitrosopolaris sp.]|jgi:hypothetical protein
MSNVEEIRRKFQEFQTTCKTILPKVDPLLVEDVILRQQQNPQEQLMYTVEVFSDGSRNPEDVKKDILAATGTVPSIHDDATHYVVWSKTTLETLERIQQYSDVQEIKGDYTGSAASMGAAHERGERDRGRKN